MADRHDDVLEQLAQLERHRRGRWAVGALLVVAIVAALVLLLVDDAAARFAPAVAAAFLAVAALFAGSVVAQERRAADVVRELLAEREHVAGLASRVRALEEVHAAVADVAAAEDLEAVFRRLLAAAVGMSDADTAVTWLLVDDRLTVASSHGDGAPRVGASTGADEGVAGLVVRTGESLVSGRGGEWASEAVSSVVAAPLRLPDRVVGALVLERGEGGPPFDAVDRTAVALFAEQAALALRNATRLDLERERARTLADGPDGARE
jgi:GAF domain-containing protein